MANKMRITIRAYEHRIVDKAVAQIIETAKKNGADVVGPIPLPTKMEKVTILRAVHKYKDSREQFERRTHKRLLEIEGASPKAMDAMTRLDLPDGVDITLKMV